jgi:hypothetical protein
VALATVHPVAAVATPVEVVESSAIRLPVTVRFPEIVVLLVTLRVGAVTVPVKVGEAMLAFRATAEVVA